MDNQHLTAREWQSYIDKHIGWKSFDALYQEEKMRKKRRKGKPPQVSDEELLAIMFKDVTYRQHLLMVGPDDGWMIAHFIREARHDMGQWLEGTGARKVLGLAQLKS